MGSSTWGLGSLGVQSHGSGTGHLRTPLPPLGRGSSSSSWPWRRSCGGPGRAWESKPAPAPAAQRPRTTEEGRHTVNDHFSWIMHETVVLYLLVYKQMLRNECAEKIQTGDGACFQSNRSLESV